MKKIILLILLCFTLTGCTINYNLDINDDNFKETITGSVYNSELTNDDNSINMYSFLINTEQNAFYNNDNIFYNKTTNNIDNKIDFEYNYTFTSNNFNNSRIINECFDNHVFEYKEGIYYLVVSGKFNCYYTNTNINITTDYKVISNNATDKKDNTYTWTINEENKDDVYFFITIDKTNNNKISFEWNTFKTIGLIIILLLSGICIYFIKKEK